MIPVHDIEAAVVLPEGQNLGYPAGDQISEEGFGAFRGTWFLGRTTVAETRQVLDVESEIVGLLDSLAPDLVTFETLASAVEACFGGNEISEVLRGTPVERIVLEHLDVDPLGGLEIGVAGLTYVLSMVGFLTAASCRAHAGERSWSDCPVVLFGAHRWRAELFAEFVATARCGIGSDRGMLTVYAPSVADLMVLARQLFDRRSVFRRRPTDGLRPRFDGNPEQSPQQTLDFGL